MKIRNEKGQALPLVMIAIMIGAFVIPPFLGHIGTSLASSQTYENSINEEYAADAGVEHAIWNLTDGGITSNLTLPGDTVSYTLPELINGLTTNITIINKQDTIPNGFGITSVAGSRTIEATVSVNVTVDVMSWYFK